MKISAKLTGDRTLVRKSNKCTNIYMIITIIFIVFVVIFFVVVHSEIFLPDESTHHHVYCHHHRYHRHCHLFVQRAVKFSAQLMGRAMAR